MQKSNFDCIDIQKDIILFIIVLFYSVGTCFSQNVSTYSPKLSIPSSPEAALLGRFGDIPIGYYTGTANISVPLYSIKEDGLEIPIALNYHSSGIKVADEATWVGLGWDLTPEGTISVEVRGEVDLQKNQKYTCADEPETKTFRNRFLYIPVYYSIVEIGRAMATTSSPCLGDGLPIYKDPYCSMNDLIAGKRQPDIFSYNFNGHTGRFYINPDTSQVVIIDNKGEDIIFEASAGGVTAKTLDGLVYYFGMLEDSHAYRMFDISGYTYKLSKIKLPSGKTIDFTYVNEPVYNYYHTESIDFNGPSTSLVEKHLTFIAVNKKTLTKIESPTATIVFNLEDRDDIVSETAIKIKRLRSIDISSPVNNIKIKSFNFAYSYFDNSTVGINNISTSGELNKRLKLDSVKEIGYNTYGSADTSKPEYIFSYKTDIPLPQKNSFAVDIWGYYNGKDNTTYLPNLDYFHYDLDPFFSTVQKPYFKFSNNTANRYTDNTYSGAFMLTKITYPTGGFSQFEYEPNSFSNQFIPEVYKNNAAYKNNYVLDNNGFQNVVSKNFKLSREVTINFTNLISGYNVNRTAWTYQEMMGSYIEFTKTKIVGGSPITTLIKKWDLTSVLNVDFTNNNGKQWNETLVVPYDSDASASYSVKVFMPDNLNYTDNTFHSSNVNSRFTYYDDINVDTSISNQCGMRIKSIKNYTKAGSLASNKQIKYYGGKLLNKFEPLTMLRYNSKTMGGVTNGAAFEYIGFHKRISLASDDFGTNGGNPIGYDKVEEIEIQDNDVNNIGKKTFYYNNRPNKSKTGLPNIPDLTNGLISNEENYDKAGNLVSDKTYSYSVIKPVISFIGIKPVLKAFGNYVPCGDGDYSVGGGITAYYNDGPLNGAQYEYDVYPLTAAWYMPRNTISNQYFNGKILTSTESYEYNSQGKIRSVMSKNSNDDRLSTYYYYANDYPNDLPIEYTMVNKYMTGIPLQIESRKNDLPLSTRDTQYAKDVTTSEIILPKYLFAGKFNWGDNDLEKKVTYDRYDVKGNIQQYTLENGASVTLLWGYGKTLPIAKIENATYDQIATALGITTAILDTYSENNLTVINSMRSNTSLVNSMITTYTHIPLIGVSTIIDAKGDKITYTYDAFGRLLNVRDKDSNILSENKYQYQN
jgi:YD repeat-containing protein